MAARSALTGFNAWWAGRTTATLARRCFDVPEGDGGTDAIEGWLIRPAGATGPTPLLVDVHGGPASYVLFDYPPTAYWRMLWSQGWSILALNAVGSSSFGRAFAERLRGRWGEIDLPQQLAAVRRLQHEGLADARVAMAGKSYGGFLTAWTVGHTDIFHAAVVMAPLCDIDIHYGSSDSGYYTDPYAMGQDEHEVVTHVETMRRLSPGPYAGRATTPTLILQGWDDHRCPRSQAEALFVGLRRHSAAPSELVFYPGEGHHFTSEGKPSFREDAMQRIADWLAAWIDVVPAVPRDEQP